MGATLINSYAVAAAAATGTPADYGAATKLWLKPDALTGLSDNDSVVSATDEVGVVLTGHAFGGTGDGPKWRTNQLDSKAVLRCADPRFDYLDAPAVSNATDGFVEFVVAKCTDAGAPHTVLATGTAGTNGTELCPSGITAGKVGFIRAGIAVHDSSVNTPTTAFAIYVLRRLAGTFNLYLNGSPSIVTTASAPNAPTGTTCLGTDPSLGRHFVGDIAEIFRIDQALTDLQVNGLGAYLVGRYPSLTWAAL